MMRLAILASLLALAACGHDEENAGHACTTTDDCYPDIDQSTLSGAVECLQQVPDGYCTHACVTDDDCCAVDGECQTSNPEVCAPFENSGLTRCFLSCEPSVIGDMDANAYCQKYADAAFQCRSTGGGSGNRQVCVPPG
jgi:hypothetical protein